MQSNKKKKEKRRGRGGGDEKKGKERKGNERKRKERKGGEREKKEKTLNISHPKILFFITARRHPISSPFGCIIIMRGEGKGLRKKLIISFIDIYIYIYIYILYLAY